VEREKGGLGSTRVKVAQTGAGEMSLAQEGAKVLGGRVKVDSLSKATFSL